MLEQTIPFFTSINKYYEVYKNLLPIYEILWSARSVFHTHLNNEHAFVTHSFIFSRNSQSSYKENRINASKLNYISPERKTVAVYLLNLLAVLDYCQK